MCRPGYRNRTLPNWTERSSWQLAFPGMSAKRLTARGERRRTQLMEAATALFAEKGYHATSVADIVRREQVGKGVFYWYFSSKEELFCEILRHGMAGLRHAQA